MISLPPTEYDPWIFGMLTAYYNKGRQIESRIRIKVMKSKNGFTLVEIMFVVAIIGLLASMGVPAILGAMNHAKEKVREANIASIEKAKSMLTLPELVYAHGQGLDAGAVFGEGAYTESNLVACIKSVENLKELMVGDFYLIPGDIGTKAYYTETRPAYAE